MFVPAEEHCFKNTAPNGFKIIKFQECTFTRPAISWLLEYRSAVKEVETYQVSSAVTFDIVNTKGPPVRRGLLADKS